MSEVKELHWAAGFLEGDGYFSSSLSRANDLVGATCADRDILEKLQHLFGGNIRKVSGKGLGPLTKKTIYSWRLHSIKAIALMMTLYTLMGERRREKIRSILAAWRSRPSRGKSPGGLAALAATWKKGKEKKDGIR